jgi:hypothetical protein
LHHSITVSCELTAIVKANALLASPLIILAKAPRRRVSMPLERIERTPRQKIPAAQRAGVLAEAARSLARLMTTHHQAGLLRTRMATTGRVFVERRRRGHSSHEVREGEFGRSFDNGAARMQQHTARKEKGSVGRSCSRGRQSCIFARASLLPAAADRTSTRRTGGRAAGARGRPAARLDEGGDNAGAAADLPPRPSRQLPSSAAAETAST